MTQLAKMQQAVNEHPKLEPVAQDQGVGSSISMREPVFKRRHKCPVWAHLVMCSVMASCSFELSDSLRFTSIQMPALVQRGTNFWLSCQYELASVAAASSEHAGRPTSDTDPAATASAHNEQLYSVKWYKNNDEFYRLIFASGGANQQPSPSGEQQPQAVTGQQQYFSQLGVNVLMSSSNATHVRLLNASLESDGSYACEISTQNLSTIRYEKEIKVYVLPNSKLNLIGLRGLYSVGDRVELNCLSDFSRPAGALSWFINGRRVITNAQYANFFVEPQLTKPKANEPKLTRSSLVLKFKLTNEILAPASSRQTWDLLERLPANNQSQAQAPPPPPPPTTTTTSNKRNQSKLQLLKSYNEQQQQHQADARRLGVSGTRLLELLRLECRYKLTEVSDVTFAELRVASERPAPTSGVDANSASLRRRRLNRRRAAPVGQRRRPNLAAAGVAASAPAEEQSAAGRRRRLRLAKSWTNQVQQSSCPARRDELLALLSAASSGSACRLGLLALHRDDPIIVEAADDDEAALEEAGEGREEDALAGHVASPHGRDALQLPVGSIIGVNCSTLGALSPGRPMLRNSSFRAAIGDNDGEQDEAAAAVAADKSVIYCGDIEARKRLIISGKYQQQTSTEQHWSGTSLRAHKGGSQQNKRHHAAYVSFEVTTGSNSSAAPNSNDNNSNNYYNNGRRRQARSSALGDHDDKLSLSNLNGVADSSNFLQLEGPAPKSLGGQLHSGHGDSSADLDMNNMQQSAWLAPPLLEWFINNQEAPKSSASYWPELPLTSTTERQLMDHGDQKQASRPDGPPEDSTQLPSIDYREYFANFDARPNDQHLMLRLALEKRHFLTPDSMLRLRCTSTQAQVLAVESLDVSLYAMPPGVNPKTDQMSQQEQARDQRPVSSHWLHRQPQSQIKSKYLHRQQLAKSSNDQKSGLGPGGAEQFRNHYRPLGEPSGSNRAPARLPSTVWALHLLAPVLIAIVLSAGAFTRTFMERTDAFAQGQQRLSPRGDT